MKKFILILLLPLLAFAVPSQQDRAILEDGSVNILKNPGFEARLSSWNKTGTSTLIIEDANPANGLYSGKWNPGASGEFLRSDLEVHPQKLDSKTCTARIESKWSGTPGDIKWYVEDSTLAKLTTEKDLIVSAGWVSDFLAYSCPAPGTTSRIVFESTADAAELSLDDISLGKSGVSEVSQASFVGRVTFPNMPSCIWLANTVLQPFPPDADCSFPTIEGDLEAVGTKIPHFVIPNARGVYQISMTGGRISRQSADSANYTCQIQDQSDGTVVASTTWSGGAAATNQDLGNVGVGTITITDGLDHEFGVECYATANTLELAVDSSVRILYFDVLKFPLTANEAITLETVGEYWDVNIGGANPGLGNSSQTAYIPIADGSLDLVVNPGSKSSQIPCSGGNPSTGLNCSVGNEHVGLVAEISTAGRYEVCAEFSHYIAIVENEGVESFFQWIETSNTSNAIVTQGNSRIESSFTLGTGLSQGSKANPLNVCGQFNFSSAGQKTLRLMYEQNVTLTPIFNRLEADRNATFGQRDIHITMNKLDQQMPTPVFTDLTESLDSKIMADEPGEVLKKGFLDVDLRSGVPVIDDVLGNWVDSVADGGATGVIQVIITPGAFKNGQVPFCQCTPQDNTADRFCSSTSIDLGTLTFYGGVNSTGALTDDISFTIECTALRP